MITRHPGLPLLGLLLVSQPRLAAQWSVAVEATASYYGGTSRNGEADPTAFRPHHPTSLGLRVDRRFGRWGVGVGAAVAGADLIAENGSVGAILKDALDLFEVAPEVALLLGRTGPGLGVRVHAGPLIDVWSPQGGDTRTRLGGQAGLFARVAGDAAVRRLPARGGGAHRLAVQAGRAAARVRAARHVAPLGLAGTAVPALKRERPGAPRAVSSDRAAVTRRSASCAAARSACA